MTDFQNWWDGYFHETNGQKETAQAAWQARGELDAVRIAELLKCLKIQVDKIESLKRAIEIKPLSEILGELDK